MRAILLIGKGKSSERVKKVLIPVPGLAGPHPVQKTLSRPTPMSVGARLPAKTVCQLTAMLDVTTLSRASALLQGRCWRHYLSLPPAPDNGADENQRLRPRFWANDRFPPDANQCRSALAREGGVSVGSDVGCDDAFAGKRAPTGSGSSRTIYHCRQYGTTARMKISVFGQGFGQTTGSRPTPMSVGARLPAKAVCQLTAMLDVTTPSRASALLQGSVLVALFIMPPAPDNGADENQRLRPRFWANDRFPPDADECRSALAREGGVSVDGDVGCDDAFAGKRAPTGAVLAALFITAASTGQRRG
ncbi:hypothetical protein EC919_10262 [Pseudomonas graminis]|nr:hypothetical protein EC919_10262 [Pseudomonas graminis]